MNTYNVFLSPSKVIRKENSTFIPVDAKKVVSLPDYINRTADINKMYNAVKQGALDPISITDCINAYGTPFQSLRGNLLVILEGESLSEYENSFNEEKLLPELGQSGGVPQPYAWM